MGLNGHDVIAGRLASGSRLLARMALPTVPEPFYRTKPDLAIKEIDRIIAAGVRFGCVLANRAYGLSAQFRQAISARGLCWALRIPRHQKVYPADVQLIFPVTGGGAGLGPCFTRTTTRKKRSNSIDSRFTEHPGALTGRCCANE